MAGPDAAMMAGPAAIARFIETGGASAIADAFAQTDVAILENFAPHLFAGPDALDRWAAAMREHLAATRELKHCFEPAQDFAVSGDLAYFTLPTRWRGEAGGRSFTEKGGWAFVLVRAGAEWRVRNYAWAVTELEVG